MPDSSTQILIQAPKLPEPSLPQQMMQNQMVPQISSEGYKLIDRLLDPKLIYGDSLTTYLCNAHLIKDPTGTDPDSPIPGFRMVKIGGTKWKPNVNTQGLTTITAEVLMALAEDGSVTRFPEDFQLAKFCLRQAMSILGMMVANKDDWEFTNYTMLHPFGLTMWKALVAVLSRSRPEASKRALMDLLVHPNLWLSQGLGGEEKPEKKWLTF